MSVISIVCFFGPIYQGAEYSQGKTPHYRAPPVGCLLLKNVVTVVQQGGGRRARGRRPGGLPAGDPPGHPSVRPSVRASIHAVPGHSGVPRVASHGWCCARCAGALWGPPAPIGAKHRGRRIVRVPGLVPRVGAAAVAAPWTTVTRIAHARHHPGFFRPVPLCIPDP